MKAFIFDDSKSKWVEEKQELLSQDICVLLDEEEEIIYLWGGSKTSKKRFKKGYKQLKELVSNFPDLNLQLMMVKKKFSNPSSREACLYVRKSQERKKWNLII